MALVLDTGVLYAALDSGDRDHGPCSQLLLDSPEQLVIPSPVLVEIDYWLRKRATIDVWLAVCEDIGDGVYTIWPLDARLLLAAARLQARFSDHPLGLVDAAVFVTCEALGEDKVGTLDRRHFAPLRTSEGAALRLLPT